MKLRTVTITGPDDQTDIDELNTLAADFPFVEFALLLLPSDMGKPRCPTISWIQDFKAHYKGDHKAMHLCGDALLDFVKGDKEIMKLMDGFSRIQLNLEFGAVEGRYDPDALIAQMRAHPSWIFIIQYVPEKAFLLPQLDDISNHALLFDASAGQGISPDTWPAPLAGHDCGYAGGLNPDNIAENLARIAQVAEDGTTWVDMESGVRTNDRFDTAKVRRILEACGPYTA